jgi:hypothetical protein
MDPLPLGPFLGENNRLPDYKLTTEAGAFVRSAVNVDLTDAGTFQRRAGATKVIPGIDCHSLWGGASAAYFMDGGTMHRINPDGASTTIIGTGLPTARRMAFADAPGEVVCTNGLDVMRIEGSSIVSLGIEPPRIQPTAAAGAGAMYKGVYQVAVSFLSPTGEESGASFPVVVDVPDNGSILITDIEQRAGYETCVYLSTANGTDLFRYARTSLSQLTIPVPFLGDGVQCRTLYMAKMPPGQLVAHLNGRLFVAAGNVLYYSEPYALGLHSPARGYIPFAESITMVEPCQNGLYVSADQTYWIDGDTLKADLNPVLPYKAIFGTSGPVPNENRCYWCSERGMVVGDQDGKVKNLQEATVATSSAVAGASMFHEHDGMKQMVASLFGPQQTVMAASSFMDAEVIRKETSL